MDDLAGKVAVITGGASGIGLAMAERFAAEGMRIVLADVERPVLAAGRWRELADGGVEVLAVPTDVSVAADVEALAAATLRALRRRAPPLQQRRRRQPGPAR